MELFQAIILGVVQAVTEWLPVSSSGHLALFQHYLGIGENVAFDVLLHMATLVVILIVFWKDILAMAKSFFSWKWDENTQLLAMIALASIPTAIIGLAFRDFFKGLFTNIPLIGLFLVINGFVLLMTRLAKAGKQLCWWKALIIGVAQGIAIIPGISRSGSTVSTGMFLGIKREKLIKLSFLMSVPAIIGAFILESGGLSLESPLALAAGSLAAIITGYFALKFVIKAIHQGKWHFFGYYCILLGAVIVVLSLA